MKLEVYFTESGGVRLKPHGPIAYTELPYLTVEEVEVPPLIPNIERLRASRNIKIPERKHATPRKRSHEALLASQKDQLLAELDSILKGKEESTDELSSLQEGDKER